MYMICMLARARKCNIFAGEVQFWCVRKLTRNYVHGAFNGMSKTQKLKTLSCFCTWGSPFAITQGRRNIKRTCLAHLHTHCFFHVHRQVTLLIGLVPRAEWIHGVHRCMEMILLLLSGVCSNSVRSSPLFFASASLETYTSSCIYMANLDA
jgi:hypothetical protein